MPRGGYRPGAGRPKGSKTLKVGPIVRVPAQILKAARASGMSPLEYMLAVMRDETQDPHVRARMAIAAAPFVHQKL